MKDYIQIGIEKSIRDTAMLYFGGSAGQQRVPASYLENFDLPLPPKGKQMEISEHIIKRHQIALRLSVSQGLSKKADSKWVDVSRNTFTWQSDENRIPIQYILGFYGYFPSNNPMCTIYVELSKPGLPASGSMAANVFTSIIDQLYNANLESLKDGKEQKEF